MVYAARQHNRRVHSDGELLRRLWNSSTRRCLQLFMAALWQAINLYFCPVVSYGRPYFHPVVSIFYLSIFFSSPNLSGRTLYVYHTSTHGVALVRI